MPTHYLSIPLPSPHERPQGSVESFASDRHLQLIERVLRDVIRIKLIYPPHNAINVRLMWLRE